MTAPRPLLIFISYYTKHLNSINTLLYSWEYIQDIHPGNARPAGMCHQSRWAVVSHTEMIDLADDNVQETLDPMTELNIKIAKMQESYDDLTSKFKEQSEMLSKALDSNMKLYAQINSPSSSSHSEQDAHSPTESERFSQSYEEIVKCYIR